MFKPFLSVLIVKEYNYITYSSKVAPRPLYDVVFVSLTTYHLLIYKTTGTSEWIDKNDKRIHRQRQQKIL